MADWRTIASGRVEQLHSPGTDKRMALSEAVARFVQPGMKINPVSLQSRATAATYELCRQFAGKNPEFEFISSSLSGNYLQLAHLGLIKKAIVSFAGEGYPTPGPSQVVNWAINDHGMEIENWTMLTISQRLMAGAMGLPFWPTRSLADSTLAEDHARTREYAEINNPFAEGEKQGVISAYQPDISFVHVWAADKAGNAVCFPPYQENVYGALAAKRGVILTVHRIVDTDFIRRHSHLVRIPAEIVLSVSEVPYGSHPYGNFSQGLDQEFAPYSNDYEFMITHRQAQLQREHYDQWVDEWIMQVADQDAYLKKLGNSKLRTLHEKALPLSWQDELDAHGESLETDAPPTSIELMIAHAAQELTNIVVEKGYRNILCGAGQALLLCWLASHHLREKGKEAALMAETGMYGFDPRPSDPFLVNYRNLPTCTLLTDVLETLGIHACGSQNECVAALGAGQLDRHGNINSTLDANGNFLVGSGGANDITNAAKEVIVVAAQRRQTFVEKLDYITSPGRAISTVISTRGIFRKDETGELALTSVFVTTERDLDHCIADIKENCSWPLKVATEVTAILPPDPKDTALLRLFDPERFFLGKRV